MGFLQNDEAKNCRAAGSSSRGPSYWRPPSRKLSRALLPAPDVQPLAVPRISPSQPLAWRPSCRSSQRPSHSLGVLQLFLHQRVNHALDFAIDRHPLYEWRQLGCGHKRNASYERVRSGTWASISTSTPRCAPRPTTMSQLRTSPSPAASSITAIRARLTEL